MSNRMEWLSKNFLDIMWNIYKMGKIFKNNKRGDPCQNESGLM